MNRLPSFAFLSALATLALSAVALSAGCNPYVVVDHHSAGGGGSSPTGTGGAGGSDLCDGLTLCGDSCVNTYNDTLNCGYCNNICYEGYCSAGQCVGYPTTTTTGPGCPADLTLCGDSCVDVFNDPFNCGSCFNQCPSGTCQDAQCIGEACATCGELITGENQAPLCEPDSSKLYDVLIQCICFESCQMLCDNACQGGGEISQECQDCILDTVQGCGNQFNECANDI